MPTKPNKKVERARRRQQVAELYVQGWTQQVIGEHLQICQTTVCFDLKALRREWRESSIRDFDSQRYVELKKLERVEREAWAAWERSQKPLQSAVLNGEGSAARARKTVKNQHGDPRFLEQVQKCLVQRRALLGLDAPTLLAPVTPSGQPLSIVGIQQLRTELLADHGYLEDLRQQAHENVLPVSWADEPMPERQGLIEDAAGCAAALEEVP
ncbi:MAG: helix-turn-helix domain-containing protein [Planctomycetia bacterium]|nr:helix-turn-helix domain-containing protein [Planctomycetia bacterium]